MKEYVCVDIGGTAMKYGVVQEEGKFLETGEIPTEAWKGGPGILEKLEQICEEAGRRHHLSGICISTAGMVDCEKGEITFSGPQIPDYAGTGLKKRMEERFGLPCEVENDVNCAGLAECLAGAAKGCASAVCLTIGTGIGGAILFHDRVYHGFSGSACEVGYMNIPGGMFQDLGSAGALLSRVAGEKGLAAADIDGKWVFEQAEAGDGCCIRAIDEMADVLGTGIANICYVLNPEIVVLGGGIMSRKEYLLPRIQAGLKKHLLPAVREKTRIAFAQNGNQAGMLGAFFHFMARHFG